ncbi:sugar phosphate isomerase/epimerase family protein [Paenibacillus arenilitoris]|uniref:Sugar phosphate isomerase/epimerase n=1 Tax=Paenibacillus arenilitoris TaxID=2772299 RepID=A0A927H3K2_9BACL|nr:sugar phosphate isomerase/epimerase [Paenibacillus arenilitoris]MBD2866945.1 sugar phosphate isomerase/epimerase [Paenibacillus arenilitoris]
MGVQAGINIFSVHEQLGSDYYGTLEKVSAMGYENIELIGFNMKKMTRFSDEFPAASVKTKLRELGLTAIAAHEGTMPGQDLLSHDWDSVMKYYEALGCETIVLPSLFVKDREQTLTAAEQMNAVGKRLKENGFRFYLHNHAHEFKASGEVTLFDLILENTDPDVLKFEVDLVWVMRAGMDPVTVLEKLGERCDIVHQKDLNKQLGGPVNIFEAMQQGGDEEMDVLQAYRKYVKGSDFVDLGTGRFDFKSTYARIHEMGHVRYALVENEGESSDKFESIRNDLSVLRQYL